MAKANELPPHNAVDGTEEMVGVIGAPGAKQVVRMPAALFAAAGTRPTPAELADAVMNTIDVGANINVVDNGDGTVSIALKPSPALEGNPTAPTPAANDNDTSIATTGFVKIATDALAAAVNDFLSEKQGTLVEGTNINLVDNGDGTFTISATGSGVSGSILTIPGGGAGLNGGQLTLGYDVADTITGQADGTWNVDVQGVANQFRIFRISTAGVVQTSVTIDEVTGIVNFPKGASVLTEAYGPTWNGSTGLPTKDAIYDKIEALDGSIGTKVAASAVGAVNGVASLDAGGKVPAGQLPSYVDDVLEFANLAAFPGVGETGKIYIAIDTNAQHRWSGSAYQAITASPGTTDNVPEGATNKYFTDARTRAAIATGLIDTAGTPAATDSVLTILGKVKKALFTDLPATVRGTAATGMAETAGTPAATDTILTVLGKLWKKAFTDLPASISAAAAARLLPITGQAAAFNVGGTDTETSYRYTGAGGHAATILDTLAVGAIVTIYHDGSGGTLSITAGAGVTIVNVGAGNTTAFTIPQMSSCVIHKVAAGRVLASPSR